MLSFRPLRPAEQLAFRAAPQSRTGPDRRAERPSEGRTRHSDDLCRFSGRGKQRRQYSRQLSSHSAVISTLCNIAGRVTHLPQPGSRYGDGTSLRSRKALRMAPSVSDQTSVVRASRRRSCAVLTIRPMVRTRPELDRAVIRRWQQLGPGSAGVRLRSAEVSQPRECGPDSCASGPAPRPPCRMSA